MKKIPAWLLLCIISLVAGLALGFTNALTKDEIARQDEAGNEQARLRRTAAWITATRLKRATRR